MGVQAKSDKYYEDYHTEWDFLKMFWKNGVKENDILKEDRATFTWENAKYSRMVTDSNEISVKKSYYTPQNLSCQKGTDVLSEGIPGN